VNADDFARSTGINEGILKSHLEGIVSTTTAMMNLKDAQASLISAAARAPHLGFGVHLNITYGNPISSTDQVSTLLNEEGTFRDFHELLTTPKNMDIEHVECEWRNQIEYFLETNVPLDHLDSHHHAAAFSKELFELFLDLAVEYGCGVRNPKPIDLDELNLHALYSEGMMDFIQHEAQIMMQQNEVPHPEGFLASFFAEKATLEHLRNLLQKLKPGVYELMCHPGFFDTDLAESSSYAQLREQELDTLTHQDAIDLIQENNIQLNSFRTARLA
jgi:predicted glycoside hydrolase/deacetylase ChbG (UPF0249 family)